MLTFLLSILLTSAVAQEPARTNAPAAQERTAEADEQHDFGDVHEGTETTATFTVTNAARQAAAVTAPDLPPGIRVVLPEEPVAPGQTATVTVTLTGDRSVDGDVVVHVGTNRHVIRIKGTVLPKPVGGAPTSTGGPVYR